jgi:hypothetical protein
MLNLLQIISSLKCAVYYPTLRKVEQAAPWTALVFQVFVFNTIYFIFFFLVHLVTNFNSSL